MTEYEKGLPVHIISGKPEKLKNILGEVVKQRGDRPVPLRGNGEESPCDFLL